VCQGAAIGYQLQLRRNLERARTSYGSASQLSNTGEGCRAVGAFEPGLSPVEQSDRVFRCRRTQVHVALCCRPASS
jgi:hypothetical protein